MALNLNNFTNDSDSASRRARLRPRPAAYTQIFGSSGLMNTLKATNGLVWPYQPTVTYGQDVEYSSNPMVHTNQEIMSYSRTKAVNLTVDGQFTCQNQTEGLYALACIHFLRTVTKMYFGAGPNGPNPHAGTPPPTLLFDAYGDYMFNALPVIVTNFTVSLPNDVDYVPVNMSGLTVPALVNNLIPPALQDVYSNAQQIASLASITPSLTNLSNLSPGNLVSSITNTLGGGPYVWLPAVFSIQVSITVQQTPNNLLNVFNLDSFRSGQLLKQGGWL
jgi:hypothetical protein